MLPATGIATPAIVRPVVLILVADRLPATVMRPLPPLVLTLNTEPFLLANWDTSNSVLVVTYTPERPKSGLPPDMIPPLLPLVFCTL